MGQQHSYYGSDWCAKIIDDLQNMKAFEVGIVSDRRRRGTAINVDVTDEDREQNLFVLQVRQCIFHPKKYNKVRKNYFLCGRNENGNAFSHPVPVIKTNARVEAALCKIWSCTPSVLPNIIRQGDVAVIPTKFSETVGDPLPAMDFVINSDHSTHVFTPGKLYTFCPDPGPRQYYVAESIQIRHTKGQHPFVSATLKPGKLYRVQIGIRSDPWQFALGTAD